MEDFVPFELAKKLNEKGFKTENTNCTNWFYLYGNLVQVKQYINISPYEYVPTIAQVFKWLREEKNIYVMIDRSFSVKNSWHYVICNNDDFEHLTQQESIPNRKWEQAAIEGIEYVIDNLI